MILLEVVLDWAFQVAPVVKNQPADAGDTGDRVRSLAREDPLEEGVPPQCSCLVSPMDRGAWWATVHGVTESQTGLKRLSLHACSSRLLLEKHFFFFLYDSSIFNFFEKPQYCFPVVVVVIMYSPTNSAQGFPSHHILVICCLSKKIFFH